MDINKSKKYFLGLLILLTSLSSLTFSQWIDPEKESHYKLFISINQSVSIGFQNHIPINDHIYIDNMVAIKPKFIFNDKLKKSISFLQSIQIYKVGYQRNWIKTDDVKYVNMLFFETLE